MWPAKEKRQNPQPWIMYAPTLPAYPDRHEKWMHQQFVDAGIAVAGIDVGEAHGSPTSQKLFTALYQELTLNHGFAKKVCLFGRSRGGLWCSSWAVNHPEKLSGFIGIYPVFDIRTYPKLSRAAPAYGLTLEQLEASLDQHNPIARMNILAKAKIPMMIIHGEIDKVVPIKENSGTVEKLYQQAGNEDAIKLIRVADQGHNFWPGFFNNQPLVDFAIKHAKAGAEAGSGQ
ncbi:MAG: alpha/beta hydrolase [Blastopirellula sp.]|nr:MAG: alpha/beta hydrolase [Blastopirellula sp.]